MLKHVGLLVGMTAIAILFAVPAVYVEVLVLEAQVTTGPEIRLDEWLQQFRLWASVGIGTAWLAAVVWYLSSVRTNLNDWMASSRRVIWMLLALLPSLALVASWLRTPPAQEGSLLAASLYFLNNALVYYLATAFFSPSSFKYTPVGATAIRRW